MRDDAGKRTALFFFGDDDVASGDGAVDVAADDADGDARCSKAKCAIAAFVARVWRPDVGGDRFPATDPSYALEAQTEFAHNQARLEAA